MIEDPRFINDLGRNIICGVSYGIERQDDE